MSIHSFSWSRVFCGFTLFALLSLSGCHPSGGLSMEDEESVVSDDSPLAMVQIPGEPTSETPSARFEGTNATAFTSQPVLLAPRARQLCDVVTIAPGTRVRIPYVLPQGWRCVAHEVHVLRAITDPACDYHRVKPLPADFISPGDLRRGYMLHVQVPLASALPGWNGSSLQLALAFELAREVPAEVLE